jgi:hypothetical protein
MKIKFAVLAAILMSGSIMHADTISVNLGQSNEAYMLIGTGGSNGYGTYLAEQGSCVAGAIDTTCTLSGTYTGSTTGYTSGTYDLTTTYANAEGGLPAKSSTPVALDGGNYFMLEPPFDSDVQMSLLLDDISGLKTVPMVVDGAFVADSYLISGPDSVCTNLPVGVPCTQGNVGLYNGATISGPVEGTVIFNIPNSAVPEPGWLVLGGLPGALLMLRRRMARAA